MPRPHTESESSARGSSTGGPVDVGPRAWERVCLHLDGIAVAPTLAALSGTAAQRALLEEDVDAVDLAARVGASPGHFRVALRTLEIQGWLRPVETVGDREILRVTEAGRRALRASEEYARAFEHLHRWEDYASHLRGESTASDLQGALDTLRAAPRPPASDSFGHRLAHHRDGLVLGPLLFALLRLGALRGIDGEEASFDLAGVPGDRAAFADAFDALESLGWVRRRGSSVEWQPEGRATFRLSGQYWYAAYYIELLLATRELLFGPEAGRDRIRKGTRPEMEPRLDREMSMEFSGRVFAGPVGKPFLRLFLPIFNREPVEEQPRVLVDTGSGDGTMLRFLHQCVRRHTRRGARLDELPLILVGAEYHGVARAATAATLEAYGAPHHVVPGDIDAPEALREELAQVGIEMEGALHVSKSVVHNRVYRLPRDRAAAADRVARTRWVPVDEEGGAISRGDYEQSLVEHFARWHACVPRFGMVIADPHTVPPEVVTRNLGRTIQPILEVTHGYSNQYLVESEVFRACMEEGGFTVPFHETAGRDVLGHDYVSVSRLVG